MANATYEVRELRVVIHPELTELYVLCGPDSDGGMLVSGWYKRVIPPSAGPALDVLREDLAKQSYLTEWDRCAPPRKEPA